MRAWKPRVRKFRFEYRMGGLRRLPPGERWFVERRWWRTQEAARFPSWKAAMEYANSLPVIAHF